MVLTEVTIIKANSYKVMNLTRSTNTTVYEPYQGSTKPITYYITISLAVSRHLKNGKTCINIEFTDSYLDFSLTPHKV